VARIAVIGIGNVLTGDDGVGPNVARRLDAAWDLPEVEVIDAGTPGLDLTTILAGVEAAVLVDAVSARGAPGELRSYDKAILLSRPPAMALSPHEPGVREALMNAEFLGASPAVVTLVGVIPETVALGCRLSPAVQAAVPGAIEAVLVILRGLGVAPVPRTPPRDPDLWWERGQEA
jgi:hydrogenase maturation protease